MKKKNPWLPCPPFPEHGEAVEWIDDRGKRFDGFFVDDTGEPTFTDLPANDITDEFIDPAATNWQVEDIWQWRPKPVV